MTHDFLKYKELKYKAIETRFDGYRFRSRLEARWAVFFKTLGIPYEYEKEGYHLDGVQYLPDFWLPTLDSWVEIKGQAPTEEERHKARMLALYTKKPVFTFSGNITSPDSHSSQDIQVDYPPSLYAYTDNTEERHGFTEEEIIVTPEILTLFQLAHEAHLEISLYHQSVRVRSNIQLIPGHPTYGLSHFLLKNQEQAQRLSMVEPLIKKHWDELDDLVCSIDPKWEVWFSNQRTVPGLLWVECDECHQIYISTDDYFHDIHSGDTPGIGVSGTPRIVSAYTAARQARFEYGEKGMVEA